MKLLKKDIKRFLMQQKLLLKEYSFLPVAKKQEASIVIMLHNERQHGGLLDRIKGIVSAYNLAKEKGYDFAICTNNATFNLGKFLPSKKEGTYINKSALFYNRWLSGPIYLYNVFSYGRGKLLQLFSSTKNQYHVYCNVDYLKQLFPNDDQNELNEKWRNSFFELFGFADYFENHYQQNLATSNQNICGIHLRFHSLLGDFKEVISNALPEECQQELIDTCLNHITTIIEEKAFERFLIVSDSIVFLKRMQAFATEKNYADKVVILEGSIAHIDVDHSEEVLQKTILDFYLLHKCHTIYQVLGPNMHNSQFSKYAAVLGKSNYILNRI